MRQTDILILGASASAYPFAAKYKEHCLVADGGITPCGEFADTFSYTPFDASHPLSPLAKDVRDELLTRGLMNESGAFHIPPVGGVFCKRFSETGCHLLAETSVASVARADGAFLVTLFNAADGYTVYRAETLIDTRTHSFMPCRTAFAVLLAGEKNAPVFKEDGVNVQHGLFEDEYAVRFDVPFERSVPECQRMAYAFLEGRRAVLGQARIAGIAMRKAHIFDAPYDETTDGIRYLASESFPTLLDAVSGGERA